MCLVHELEELVDDSLQEPPMGPQEPRVLANDVHDVGGDDGLIVLALLLLAKAKQVLGRSQIDSINTRKHGTLRRLRKTIRHKSQLLLLVVFRFP